MYVYSSRRHLFCSSLWHFHVWCYGMFLVCVLQVGCVEKQHEQFRRLLQKDTAASKRLVS